MASLWCHGQAGTHGEAGDRLCPTLTLGDPAALSREQSPSDSPGLSLFFLGGAHPWHMELPRLGVELELQLLVYTTAAATPEP